MQSHFLRKSRMQNFSPECVGFGDRLIACAIDGLLVFIIAGPLAAAGLPGFAIATAAPALAVILFWRRYGATPGKLAVFARIVDARSGAAASTGRLVGRYFAYLISALPLFLGFAWIAIDRRKQGWHDKIAGTLVIYETD